MLSQISSYVSRIATKRKQLSASEYPAAKNKNIFPEVEMISWVPQSSIRKRRVSSIVLNENEEKKNYYRQEWQRWKPPPKGTIYASQENERMLFPLSSSPAANLWTR